MLIILLFDKPKIIIVYKKQVLGLPSLQFARGQLNQPTITNENQRLPRGSYLLTRWFYNYFHSWSVKKMCLEDFYVSNGHFLL